MEQGGQRKIAQNGLLEGLLKTEMMSITLQLFVLL
jgi:hypothetical protein